MTHPREPAAPGGPTADDDPTGRATGTDPRPGGDGGQSAGAGPVAAEAARTELPVAAGRGAGPAAVGPAGAGRVGGLPLVPRPRAPHHHVVVVEDDDVAGVTALLEGDDPEGDDLDGDVDVDLPAPVADVVDAAWAQFKATGDRRQRERLILHYAPLVTAVATRVGMRLPSSVEHADLVSAGMFGLIDAIEKYEPGRAVKFRTYAGSRIHGAIIDELRATDWIPRSVRTKARAVDRAYAELEAELRRTPQEHEVAARLGMPVAELRTVFGQIATVNVAALDEMLAGGAEPGAAPSLGDTLADHRTPDPAGSFETRETKYLLARAIEQLGEREKIVLVLYYYENMTLAEIGRVLGVTESRISQMHSAAMLRLRRTLVDSEHA